jgi:PAS domain S-box-containing protein
VIGWEDSASRADGALICLVGPDRRLTRVSAGWERLLGCTAADLLGRDVLEFVHPDDAAATERDLARGAASFRNRCRAGDGAHVRLLWSALSTGDDQMVLAAVPHGAAASRQLAAIVTATHDAVYAQSLDGVIKSWNPAAEALYGYHAAEAIGSRMDRLVAPERNGEAKELLARALTGERIEQHETVHVDRDGRRLEISLSLSPLPGADDGEFLGAAVVAQDISVRKRAVAELERSNTELQQFAYVASHDLSEPLRAISGFAQLLARRYEGSFDEDADRWLTNVTDGAERMRTLIDALLAYSRIGTTPERRETVDVGAVVADALEDLGPAIQEAGATITVGELPTVTADPTRLGQVFQNLLSNALKFRGATPPRVEVTAAREPGLWRFSVTDDGLGVDARYRERIFEIFRRLNHRRDFPGTGIGLAICRRIVEDHGGTIEVRDRVGAGSEFTFTVADA